MGRTLTLRIQIVYLNWYFVYTQVRITIIIWRLTAAAPKRPQHSFYHRNYYNNYFCRYRIVAGTIGKQTANDNCTRTHHVYTTYAYICILHTRRVHMPMRWNCLENYARCILYTAHNVLISVRVAHPVVMRSLQTINCSSKKSNGGRKKTENAHVEIVRKKIVPAFPLNEMSARVNDQLLI